MPRICTICTHPERTAIDKALVSGEPAPRIAAQFRVSEDAVSRHRARHLPPLLARAKDVEDRVRATGLQAQARAQEAQEDAHALDVQAELRRCFARVNLLFDACDRWLRDPEEPTRYDIGPRAGDIKVTYTEPGPDGKPLRRKENLSALLAKIEGSGRTVEWSETKHADPRDLVLKTAERLGSQIELLAKLVGELDERPQVNVLLAPEWVEVRTVLLSALSPYPEARAAVASGLAALEGNNGHRD